MDTLSRSKRPKYKAQNINEMLKGTYYAYYFISIILLMLRNRIRPTALSTSVCIAMDFVRIVYRRFGVRVENMKPAMNFDAERVHIFAQVHCEWCVSIKSSCWQNNFAFRSKISNIDLLRVGWNEQTASVHYPYKVCRIRLTNVNK